MSGEANNVDNSGWLAYVRYQCNKKTEYISILKIKEKKMGQNKKVLINPKSLDDFDNTKWYSIKTAQDSLDGLEHRFNGQIGKLGVDLESLQEEVDKGRRIIWSTQAGQESEPESTATEEQLDKDVTNRAIIAARAENKQVKENRKSAADTAHEQLLQTLSARNPPTVQHSNQEENENDLLDKINMKREIEELKAALKDREEQLKVAKKERAKREEAAEKERAEREEAAEKERAEREEAARKAALVPPINDVVQELRRLTQAVQSQDSKIASMESKLSTYMTPSTSGVSSATSLGTALSIPDADVRVPLGGDYTCAKLQYDMLQDITIEDNEWCLFLLRGVFGNSFEHKMRTKVLKDNRDGCRKMDQKFLHIAKDLYDKRVRKKQILDPQLNIMRAHTEEEIVHLKNSLPSYISGRSYSLLKQKEAAEGVNKRLKRVKNLPCGEGAPTNPESTEGAPNGGEHQQDALNGSPKTPKRRYRKRGQAVMAKAGEQQEPLNADAAPRVQDHPPNQVPPQSSEQHPTLQQPAVSHSLSQESQVAPLSAATMSQAGNSTQPWPWPNQLWDHNDDHILSQSLNMLS